MSASEPSLGRIFMIPGMLEINFKSPANYNIEPPRRGIFWFWPSRSLFSSNRNSVVKLNLTCQQIICYQSHWEDKTGEYFFFPPDSHQRHLALEVLFHWMVEAVLFNILWDIIVLRSIIWVHCGQHSWFDLINTTSSLSEHWVSSLQFEQWIWVRDLPCYCFPWVWF